MISVFRFFSDLAPPTQLFFTHAFKIFIWNILPNDLGGLFVIYMCFMVFDETVLKSLCHQSMFERVQSIAGFLFFRNENKVF